MRNHQDITFESADGVNVRLFFVDVANIEDCFSDIRVRLILNSKEKGRLCLWQSTL